MPISPITSFPAAEAACVFDCLNGTCKEDAACKLHCAAIFFSYAQRQAQTAAQPAGLHAGAYTLDNLKADLPGILEAHKSGGMHGLNLPWLQIAQAVLTLLLQIFAGLTPVPTPPKASTPPVSLKAWHEALFSAECGPQSFLDTILDFCGATAAKQVETCLESAHGRGVGWTCIAKAAAPFLLNVFKVGSIDVDGLTAAIDAL